MDFFIQKQDIVNSLSVTSGVTEKKTLDVLSNVLIEVKEGLLTLTATDLESWIVTSTQISNFVSGGKTTVDAKKLADLCRLLPENSEIHFSYDSDKLKIEAGTGTYLLATLPSDSFPVFEDFGESEQMTPGFYLGALIIFSTVLGNAALKSIQRRRLKKKETH